MLTLDAETGTRGDIAYQALDPSGRWSAPVRVASAVQMPNAGDHAGDDIQLAASGSDLVALWEIPGSGWGGSGPLVCAYSKDGGKHWQRGTSPADDDTTEGHGFVDLAADGEGGFHAVWLDGRSGHQSLYASASHDDGMHWSKDVCLRDMPCECCWNRIIAGAARDLFVLYRDQSPRDMAVAVSLDGGNGWTNHTSLGKFNWDIDMCPHVGGGLALSGGALHAVVWTGKPRAKGLYYLESGNNAKAWTTPIRLGDEKAHHADLAVSADGKRLAAIWDRAEGDGESIYASVSMDQGKSWSDPKRISRADVHAIHPRIVPWQQEGFKAFWTEQAARGKAAFLGTSNL